MGRGHALPGWRVREAADHLQAGVGVEPSSAEAAWDIRDQTWTDAGRGREPV